VEYDDAEVLPLDIKIGMDNHQAVITLTNARQRFYRKTTSLFYEHDSVADLAKCLVGYFGGTRVACTAWAGEGNSFFFDLGHCAPEQTAWVVSRYGNQDWTASEPIWLPLRGEIVNVFVCDTAQLLESATAAFHKFQAEVGDNTKYHHSRGFNFPVAELEQLEELRSTRRR
jgi:hypothetical protein